MSIIQTLTKLIKIAPNLFYVILATKVIPLFKTPKCFIVKLSLLDKIYNVPTIKCAANSMPNRFNH